MRASIDVARDSLGLALAVQPAFAQHRCCALSAPHIATMTVRVQTCGQAAVGAHPAMQRRQRKPGDADRLATALLWEDGSQPVGRQQVEERGPFAGS